MKARFLLGIAFVLFGVNASFAATPQVVQLWPAGSPTLKGADEKEITTPENVKPGDRINSIRNVHTPTIEVYLPSGKATGTGVIVAPGGGHRQLVIGSEGTDIAKWLNELGVAAFVLKYRLAFTPNYQYTVEGEALQDTQRALRIVRARASEWGVKPDCIGLLGFSAGGALAALADIRFDRGKSASSDPIEQQSCRPDFVALVYPGWNPAMDITAPQDAAPAFLTSAGKDDASHARQTVEFYNSLFKVGVPVELHIYSHGGHGKAIHPRDGIPFGTWHVRMQEWMTDLGVLSVAAVVDEKSGASAQSDAKAQEGIWKPIAAVLGGTTLPPPALQAITLKITGGNYEVTIVGEGPDKGTCTLDTSATPKRMTIKGTDGPNKGKTFLAIYEMKDADSMRICYDLSGSKFPKEFTAPKGTPLYLVGYRKQKE